MKLLFVHQNFPGQYVHLATALAADARNQVIAITQRMDCPVPGVRAIRYQPKPDVARQGHHYLAGTEAGIRNGQDVARVAMRLRQSGFRPDVMLGHNAWGEIWFLKDVFPDTPLVGYFEFFYRLHGSDVDFNPAFQASADDGPRLRIKNAGNLLGLDAVDLGQCPAQWQRSQFPSRYHDVLRVLHDGIDTSRVKPDGDARLRWPHADTEFRPGDEVVTYVARNLETYRGFESFMRCLPTVMARRPGAHIVIVGGDDVSYGRRPADGRPLRETMLQELGGTLDTARLHFLGRVPYATFVALLQVSAVHVYLTYPFVLSWSVLEAMSAGCVVVGSATAPVQEVITHGDNGLLVEFFDPDAIAERVLEVLCSPRDYEGLRVRARQTIVERYDLATTCLPAQRALLDNLATGGPMARQAQSPGSTGDQPPSAAVRSISSIL